MKVYTPETELHEISGDISVFLAGTIEMGKSIDWQKDLISKISHLSNVSAFNPRRENWSEEPKKIVEQIKWELQHIDKCDIIFMHLAKESVSPISLYELGLLQGGKLRDRKMILSCDPDFSRNFNVWVTTGDEKFLNSNIELFSDFDSATKRLIELLSKED